MHPNDGAPRPLPAILVGGLLAGALDITYAITWLALHGKPPMWTLQSVASGALGKAAFDGGWGSALVGLLFQFVIACGAATVFYVASRFVPALTERAVPAGLVFGVCVWLVMSFAVVPLSAAPFKMSFPLASVVRNVLVHMFLIGLPIALSVRRYAPARP
jgi:hypothetical protein